MRALLALLAVGGTECEFVFDLESHEPVNAPRGCSPAICVSQLRVSAQPFLHPRDQRYADGEATSARLGGINAR